MYVRFFSVLDKRTGIRQPDIRSSAHISVRSDSRKKKRGAHGEYNNADGPAVDKVVIALDLHAFRDNFGGEVVRRPAHGLFGENKNKIIYSNKETWIRPTLSMVRLSTTLARPKSATLTVGGSSFVRRTFCEIDFQCQKRAKELGNAYLGLEVAMRNPLSVYVLYTS